MKHAADKSVPDILSQIETIEKDILVLKLAVLKKLAPTGKRTVKLKGILKGINVTDEDIISAKQSLYGKVQI